MFIINSNLLTLCHSDLFQPSKAHLQGVRQMHFDRKTNTMNYQMHNAAY